MAVDVSIIVCTRDRCEDLKHSLGKLRDVKIPPEWNVELIVVDNGSSDATRVVVDSSNIPGMSVIYLLEDRKGKAHALNTGVSTARGRVLLFTDDDVHVPSNWLEGMCRPILSGNADAVQGGIAIAPHLERPWLRGVLRVWIATVDDPDRKPEGLVGANMACSRDALDTALPFDLRLGPGAAGFFDDTIIGWDIERAGLKILYAPSVRVEHHFDDSRLTVPGFMAIARRMAHSRAIVEHRLNPNLTPPTFISLLAELPGLAARSLTQAMRYVLKGQPDAGFLARYYRVLLWSELQASQSLTTPAHSSP